MKTRLIIFIVITLLILFCAWQVIMPLYKPAPMRLAVASIVKPATPLQAKFLRGHWTLVFFGYMDCPKICPSMLNLVRDAWNTYQDASPPARFVFANITPSDPQALQNFLHNYHAEFRGIGNDDPEMQHLYEKLSIYSATDQDGTINHTAALMLIDPQARLRAVFSPPFTAEELMADLNTIIN